MSRPPSARSSTRKLNTGSKSKPGLVLLFGPTAVGKTDIIKELFDTSFELISADALQVYRGMDIGTAKPSRKERERIPHHLIDIREPDEGFDLGSFVRTAEERAQEIISRRRIPVVSGGSAFYLIHFLRGLPHSPPSDTCIREELRQRLRKEGPEALYEELTLVDPVSANRIHVNDVYRILRAMEVYRLTGYPLSGFDVPSEPRDSWRFLVIGLHRDREELYERIEARVEKMFCEGLVEELRGLLRRGCREEDPGMRGIGYREFFRMRRTGELVFEEVKEEIARSSRRYAKRQLTFFRKLKEAEFFHPDEREKLGKRLKSFIDEISDITDFSRK